MHTVQSHRDLPFKLVISVTSMTSSSCFTLSLIDFKNTLHVEPIFLTDFSHFRQTFAPISFCLLVATSKFSFPGMVNLLNISIYFSTEI